MVSCTVNLTRALANNIQHIRDVFFQDEFIPDQISEQIMSKFLVSTDKSRILVGFLTDRVKTSSRHFDYIVRVLRDEGPWISDLCDQLEEKRRGETNQ